VKKPALAAAKQNYGKIRAAQNSRCPSCKPLMVVTSCGQLQSIWRLVRLFNAIAGSPCWWPSRAVRITYSISLLPLHPGHHGALRLFGPA
jgi:hypothetical protein